MAKILDYLSETDWLGVLTFTGLALTGFAVLFNSPKAELLADLTKIIGSCWVGTKIKT